MNVVIEELKQRITAIAAKVRRYQGWADSYTQKRLFENNQRQFYRELDQKKKIVMMISHKKDAKWLQDLRSEVNVKKQEKIDITTGQIDITKFYFLKAPAHYFTILI